MSPDEPATDRYHEAAESTFLFRDLSRATCTTEMTGSTLSKEKTDGTIGTLGPIAYRRHLVSQRNYRHHEANWINQSDKLGKILSLTGSALASQEPVVK